MTRGVSLSFAVLLLAYLIRLPPTAEWLPSAAGWSAARVGQAPLVFGVGPVNVFNESDLRAFRNHAAPGLLGPDGRISPVTYSPGEAVDSALTGRLRVIALEPLFCDQEFARMWFGGLAQATPPSHPYRQGTIFMTFRTWTRPTNQEFKSFRYTPIEWETMCVITASLDEPNRVSTEYLAAAVPRLATAGLDFEPTLRRITLASRFPCRVERPTAALRYDHLRRTARTTADREALEEALEEPLEDLLRGEHRGAFQCVSAYKRLTQELGAAEQRAAYLPATATCESELAIAELYVSEVFDDALRQETIPQLDAARVAQRARQTESCRAAVGDIRRAYFEAIYGSN